MGRADSGLVGGTLPLGMARVQNPILFSAYFGVPPKTIAAAGLIDPFLNVDVPLFIDPVLLEKSSNTTIATLAVDRFRRHSRYWCGC